MSKKFKEQKVNTLENYVLINYTKGRFNKYSVSGYSGGKKGTFSAYRYFINWHPEADIEIRGNRNTSKYKLRK